MGRRISLCLLLVFSAASAFAQKIGARDGNIYLSDERGEHRLTSSGHDRDPLLSPDKQWLVFVREIPGKSIATGAGDSAATELWQIRADGKEPTLLVKPRESDDPQKIIGGIENLQFSSNGRLVYFVSAAYAVSGAVHVVDTTNGKERFFVAGSGLEVVHSGEYKDCLLVSQHRYFIGGGSYDWYWLFRPDGKEVGPVGEETENFKKTYGE